MRHEETNALINEWCKHMYLRRFAGVCQNERRILAILLLPHSLRSCIRKLCLGFHFCCFVVKKCIRRTIIAGTYDFALLALYASYWPFIALSRQSAHMIPRDHTRTP
jgi:hypothetical protein